MSESDNREIGRVVLRALLAAAGPTGTIQISFRIFPNDVEVDVLHSDRGEPGDPALAQLRTLRAAAAESEAVAESGESQPSSFAEWMSQVLRREGLTRQAAARQLGVSVRTVARWVGGETEPRMRDLRRIQERFGDSPLP